MEDIKYIRTWSRTKESIRADYITLSVIFVLGIAVLLSDHSWNVGLSLVAFFIFLLSGGFKAIREAHYVLDEEGIIYIDGFHWKQNRPFVLKWKDVVRVEAKNWLIFKTFGLIYFDERKQRKIYWIKLTNFPKEIVKDILERVPRQVEVFIQGDFSKYISLPISSKMY